MGKRNSESDFQSKLKKEIEERFPGSVVLKNDAVTKPGIPDLSVFYEKHWAWLECKKSATAIKRPNQEFYISKGNEMSFARFVYPENKEEVLDELERSFKA